MRIFGGEWVIGWLLLSLLPVQGVLGAAMSQTPPSRYFLTKRLMRSDGRTPSLPLLVISKLGFQFSHSVLELLDDW